uniref:Uncharacterized protein n=1 Tax=Arundo donax TaxID=35708 RepID=A0A0A9DU90_ARUDO
MTEIYKTTVIKIAHSDAEKYCPDRIDS